MNSVIQEMNDKNNKTIEAYKKDLSKIRTGRASISILDNIRVTAYGSPMPLNQVASLTIPDSRTICIQPWDAKIGGEIEKAILKSDLGLTPTNDGRIIRITIPTPNEERRKDLVKQVKKLAEEYKVVIRNHRRDSIEVLKKQKKDKAISEDDMFKLQDEAQKETDRFIVQIDKILTEKEKEVMEV